MVAIFLDHNKPKTSLKKWIHPVSNFIHLIQFHLICQMLTKFSVVESKRTVSKFRKRKRKILCCVHWHSISGCVKLGSFRLQSCNNGWKMYKKVWCICIHIVVVLLYKPTAFLPFLLLSPLSLLKLPIIVIQKFCHHGNVMTHFSSLLSYWNKVYSTLIFCKHLMINGAIAQNRCFFSAFFGWAQSGRGTRDIRDGGLITDQAVLLSFFLAKKKKDTWSQVILVPFLVMSASGSTSTLCFVRKNIACYADYKGAIDFTFWRHLPFLHHWPTFWHFPPEQIWIVFCSVVSVQQQEMALVIHSYHLLTLALLPLKINTFVNSFTNYASLFGLVWVPSKSHFKFEHHQIRLRSSNLVNIFAQLVTQHCCIASWEVLLLVLPPSLFTCHKFQCCKLRQHAVQSRPKLYFFQQTFIILSLASQLAMHHNDCDWSIFLH